MAGHHHQQAAGGRQTPGRRPSGTMLRLSLLKRVADQRSPRLDRDDINVDHGHPWA
jgi:hypothetical protein